MNKQKGIIIGVLALAVTMMVGYAIFSETITINGTATAKGDFDVGIECQKSIDTSVISVNDFKSLYEDSYTAEGGYKNDSCSVAGNTMSFSSELEYPGATRYFTAKVTNNGTIDAILDVSGEDLGISQKVYYDANDNGAFEENEIFDPSKSYGTVNDAIIRGAMAIDFNIYGFEKADGTKFNVLNATQKQMNEFVTGENGSLITLKPGDSVYFVFKTQLNKDFGNTSGGSIYTKTETSYTFTFSQPRAN